MPPIQISTLLLNNLAMTLCGILIIICPLLPSYEWLVAFAVLLGITDCNSQLLLSLLIRKTIISYRFFRSMFLCIETDPIGGVVGNGKRQQRLRFHVLVLRDC